MNSTPPSPRCSQFKQVPLGVLQDVCPAQVTVAPSGHLAVGVALALAGEGEHLAAGHVLTPPGAGLDPAHRTGGVHHAARHLAGLQPEDEVPGAAVLAPVLPHVPVGVGHQVGVGEDVGGVEPRQEAVVLVVVGGEPEAEAVAELLTAAPAGAQREGGDGEDVPHHGAVVLGAGALLAVTSDNTTGLISVRDPGTDLTILLSYDYCYL